MEVRKGQREAGTGPGYDWDPEPPWYQGGVVPCNTYGLNRMFTWNYFQATDDGLPLIANREYRVEFKMHKGACPPFWPSIYDSYIEFDTVP